MPGQVPGIPEPLPSERAGDSMTIHGLFSFCAALLLLLVVATPVRGQTRIEVERPTLLPGIGAPPAGVSVGGGVEERQKGGSVADSVPSGRSWWTLWSRRSPHDRILLGMWTFHPFGDDPYPREANNGLGVQFRSLFAFTCVNSFDKRTYAVGLERAWGGARRGPYGVMLGFRIGLIHGYDTELFRIAGETPILPFAGTVALFRVGPLGGEVSWVYQAVSVVGAVFY